MITRRGTSPAARAAAAIPASVLPLVVALQGCGGSVDHGTETTAHGTPEAGLDAAGSGSGDAGFNARDASTTETGSRPEADGDMAWEGGTPPPYCVAPCIWDAVRDCLPSLGACRVRSGGSRVCDPTTGWAVVRSVISRAGSTLEVLDAGTRCFYHSPLGMSAQLGWQFHGRDGPIGFGTRDRITCTTTSRYDLGLLGEPMLPRDAIEHLLEPERPECAAWDEYGYPVGALECASETEGSCADGG